MKVGPPIRLVPSDSANPLSWEARIVSDGHEEIGALWDGREDRFAIVPRALAEAAQECCDLITEYFLRAHPELTEAVLAVKEWPEWNRHLAEDPECSRQDRAYIRLLLATAAYGQGLRGDEVRSFPRSLADSEKLGRVNV